MHLHEKNKLRRVISNKTERCTFFSPTVADSFSDVALCMHYVCVPLADSLTIFRSCSTYDSTCDITGAATMMDSQSLGPTPNVKCLAILSVEPR